MESALKDDRTLERSLRASDVESRVDDRATARTRALAWKIWLPIPILLMLLDVTFNLYFWRIPKLTEPNTDAGYQFLLNVHRESQPKPPGSVRVLALGSSIAGSFDDDQVQGLVAASVPSHPTRVTRLLVPGIKPSEFRLLFGVERATLDPDAVVVLLNLVDFINPSFERDLKPQVRAVLPPWQTLVERHEQIAGVAGKLDLLAASASNLYRYRKLIRTSLQGHVKLGLRWLRGRSVKGGYGVYADGYTKRQFGLPVDGTTAVDLEYFVHPEWIRQRGRVGLTFSAGRSVLASEIETEPGWKRIHLNLPAHSRHVLDVAADSYWNPRAAGLNDDVRLLGLQLRQPGPVSALKGREAPLTYPPGEVQQPHELLRMGDAVGQDYVERWERTLAENTPFARRFRGYREAKLTIRDRAFEPTGEYAELDRLVANFAQHGTAVAIVLTPESPLLFSQYRDTPYYRAHLQFFRDLAAKYRGVRFHDLSEVLPPEDFNDWHHVNYIGNIKLGPLYADIIRQAVTGGRPGRPQG